jgi:glycerol-3-phosphate acyltransferase PlsY
MIYIIGTVTLAELRQKLFPKSAIDRWGIGDTGTSNRVKRQAQND